MDRIKDYDVFGIKLDVVYFTTKHNEMSFPKVKDIFHSDVRITNIIDRNICEKIESELYKTLNNIPVR